MTDLETKLQGLWESVKNGRYLIACAIGLAAGIYLAWKYLDPLIMKQTADYASIQVQNTPDTLKCAMAFDNSSPWQTVQDLDGSSINNMIYISKTSTVAHLQADYGVNSHTIYDVGNLVKGNHYVWDVGKNTLTEAGASRLTPDAEPQRPFVYVASAFGSAMTSLAIVSGLTKLGKRLFPERPTPIHRRVVRRKKLAKKFVTLDDYRT